MRASHGVPWFALDALKMGLHLGAPSFGVHPDATISKQPTSCGRWSKAFLNI
jgi:hypothetical protein